MIRFSVRFPIQFFLSTRFQQKLYRVTTKVESRTENLFQNQLEFYFHPTVS
jgi:hypothetical protein